ncbi:MAG TPA: ABC-type transport auxiliary lipoprotein family protein [Rhodoferax sp.]|nr:ABC-type transport auxiliary lipoprotein family protein [Rhodoferax sp.]
MHTYSIRTKNLLLAALVLLAGCATQRPAETAKVYDFGPALLQTAAAGALPGLATVVLFETQVSPALEVNAVLYRLAYADAQQLKPYALARWSMPPAQLFSQRLRQQLGEQRAVVAPGEAAALFNLRLVLEEFSQVFDSPAQSHGLLRLRATLSQRMAGSETLLAQRSFVVQQPAPSPDAIGAVRALTLASDQAIGQVTAWLARFN